MDVITHKYISILVVTIPSYNPENYMDIIHKYISILAVTKILHFWKSHRDTHKCIVISVAIFIFLFWKVIYWNFSKHTHTQTKRIDLNKLIDISIQSLLPKFIDIFQIAQHPEQTGCTVLSSLKFVYILSYLFFLHENCVFWYKP